MTLLILSAIKYGENANLGRFCADLKPVDRLTKGEMPQAWQEVVVDGPAHWGHCQSFRVGNHGVNSSCRVVGSLVSGVSKVLIGLTEKGLDEGEIAFGSGGEHHGP